VGGRSAGPGGGGGSCGGGPRERRAGGGGHPAICLSPRPGCAAAAGASRAQVPLGQRSGVRALSAVPLTELGECGSPEGHVSGCKHAQGMARGLQSSTQSSATGRALVQRPHVCCRPRAARCSLRRGSTRCTRRWSSAVDSPGVQRSSAPPSAACSRRCCATRTGWLWPLRARRCAPPYGGSPCKA
jgi:hypothetical protein